MTRRKSLENAINRYEEIITDSLNTKKKIFIAGLFPIIISLIFIIVSIILVEVGALLASLGLGSMNILTVITTLGDEMKKYWKESHHLKSTVNKLRIELDLCKNNDEDCFNKVADDIRAYLNDLE